MDPKKIKRTVILGGTLAIFSFLIFVGSSMAQQAYVSGACGTAELQALWETPTTTALCSAGTPSSVSGNGPWSWSCIGSGGGATVGCGALLGPAEKPELTGFQGYNPPSSPAAYYYTGPILPNSVAQNGDVLYLYGDFAPSGNTVLIDGNAVGTSYQSQSQINVSLTGIANGTHSVTVQVPASIVSTVGTTNALSIPIVDLPSECTLTAGGDTVECLGTDPSSPNGTAASVLTQAKASCVPSSQQAAGQCYSYGTGDGLQLITYCVGNETYSPCRASVIDPTAAGLEAQATQDLDAATGHPDTCVAMLNTAPYIWPNTGLAYTYSTVCTPVGASASVGTSSGNVTPPPPAATTPPPANSNTTVQATPPPAAQTPPPAQANVIASVQGYDPTTGTYTSSSTVQQGSNLVMSGTFGGSGNTVSVVTPSFLGGTSAGATIISQNASQIEVSLTNVPAGNHTVTILTPSGATGSMSFTMAPPSANTSAAASTSNASATQAANSSGTTNSGGSCTNNGSGAEASLAEVTQALQGLAGVLSNGGGNLSANDISGIQTAISSIAQVVAQLGNEIAAGNCATNSSSSSGTGTATTPSPVVTGIQGYATSTGTYTNWIVTPGQYMILYGTFGASGNTISVNGIVVPEDNVVYQGAAGAPTITEPNQINIFLPAAASWLPAGTGTVTVTTSDGLVTAPASFTVAPTSTASSTTPPPANSTSASLPSPCYLSPGGTASNCSVSVPSLSATTAVPAACDALASSTLSSDLQQNVTSSAGPAGATAPVQENSSYYATPAATAELASCLGLQVVLSENSLANAPWVPPPTLQVVFPNGTMENAGFLISQLAGTGNVEAWLQNVVSPDEAHTASSGGIVPVYGTQP